MNSSILGRSLCSAPPRINRQNKGGIPTRRGRQMRLRSNRPTPGRGSFPLSPDGIMSAGESNTRSFSSADPSGSPDLLKLHFAAQSRESQPGMCQDDSKVLLVEEPGAKFSPFRLSGRRIAALCHVVGKEGIEQVKTLGEHSDDRHRQRFGRARVRAAESLMLWMIQGEHPDVRGRTDRDGRWSRLEEGSGPKNRGRLECGDFFDAAILERPLKIDRPLDQER
jgi:hypothetical protein